ncbi:hypothetical protein HOY80DRAFT_886699, partial [Tuber brumale]
FDNLFTTIPLQETLREFGIGAAGTVCTLLALPPEQVVRLHKQPLATATGANITRKVFGDQPAKYLPIPTTVDCYNHGMRSVDQAV